MKEYLQIVGCEILDNNWMEITLSPITIVKKKKVGLMDLASGDLTSLISTLGEDKIYKTKFYTKKSNWENMELSIGKKVSVDLLNDELGELMK
jgi:hypothetical protein